MKNQINWRRGLRSLTLGVVSTILTALPVRAAERIYFNYGPLGFSVSVSALETFAKQGKVDKELGFFLNRLSIEQRTQLRDFLRTRYNLKPVIVSRVTYTITGERLLKRVGEAIKTKAGQNGFYGIRAAVLLAATDPEGLTVINFLRKFPTEIQLNTKEITSVIKQISTLFKETNTLVAELEHMSSKIAASEPPSNFNQPDLRKPGIFSTARQTINLRDPVRDRQVIVDVYLPKSTQSQIPVILISNGLGGQRDRYINLAQHLTSHGFAVVIPDHIGSNDQRQKAFFAGLYKENFDAEEYINRPLDITYVLNQLEKLNSSEFKGQLNLKQIGMFGYSFGGTTALALAGAELNFEQLEKDCAPQAINPEVNISILYQCRALELPRKTFKLQDRRIKAAFIFVPFTKSLFGQAGMSRVTIPIFWQAVDEDIVTPLLLEQIPPFSWLATSNKYLVVSKRLPHTRITVQLLDKVMNTNRVKSLEKLTSVLQGYFNALSLAFFRVYVTEDEEYRRYLQASYAQALSQEPYNLSLVQFIKNAEDTPLRKR